MNHTQNTYIASLLGYDGTEDEQQAQQCDFCDFPAVHTDGQTHLCEECKAELDESNAAYQPKPGRINWKQFFEEDASATLNTFYSGVEA